MIISYIINKLYIHYHKNILSILLIKIIESLLILNYKENNYYQINIYAFLTLYDFQLNKKKKILYDIDHSKKGNH